MTISEAVLTQDRVMTDRWIGGQTDISQQQILGLCIAWPWPWPWFIPYPTGHIGPLCGFCCKRVFYSSKLQTHCETSPSGMASLASRR